MRCRKSRLYRANPPRNASLTGMKTSPKFLISGTEHAKTDGFFTLYMKSYLTHKYSSSAEPSGLCVFSLEGTSAMERHRKQAQAKK